MPLHLKKKMKLEKNKMRTFEIMPPSGSLLPGQKINIQIKFMPTEEVRCYCYSHPYLPRIPSLISCY